MIFISMLTEVKFFLQKEIRRSRFAHGKVMKKKRNKTKKQQQQQQQQKNDKNKCLQKSLQK